MSCHLSNNTSKYNLSHGIKCYINTLTEQVILRCHLCADDSMLYREIYIQEDWCTLQTDMDVLAAWEKQWGMEYNLDKCPLMGVIQKQKPSMATLHLTITPPRTHNPCAISRSPNL